MPVPEPMTAAFAIFSYYAMVRTGLERIIDDIGTWRHYEDEAKDLLTELNSLITELDCWVSYWHLDKDAPKELFDVLWGEQVSYNIAETLSGLKKDFKSSRKLLKTLKAVGKESQHEWERASRIRKEWLKFRFIWVDQHKLQRTLSHARGKVNQIQKDATNGWTSRGVGEATLENIYILVMQEMILPMSRQNWKDMTPLVTCCYEIGEETGLELDIFDDSDVENLPDAPHTPEVRALRDRTTIRREQHRRQLIYPVSMSKSRARHHLLLNIQSDFQQRTSRSSRRDRLRVEKLEANEDATKTRLRCSTTNRAVKNVLKDKTRLSYFEAAEGAFFTIRCSNRRHNDSDNGHEDVRRVILEKSTLVPLDRNSIPSYEPFGRITTFKLAFELTQACVLFLDTPWFHQICSCAILCCCPKRNNSNYIEYEKAEFALEIGRPPNSGCCAFPASINWNKVTEAVRRLGIVVTEIIIGANVTKIQTDNAGRITNFTLKHAISIEETTIIETLDLRVKDILDRVSNAAAHNTKVLEAVRYCFTTTDFLPRGAEDNDLVAQFFTTVVQP